ncbi:MAG: substrate-binding domain-containing protein [Verrucomicrobiota bacterium]
MKIHPLFLCLTLLPGLGHGQESAPQAVPSAAEPPAEETVLLVGADAALKPALRELAQHWADLHPEIKIELELANAATLERLIGEGRPYDVVLLSGLPAADQLAEAGHLAPGQRKLVARDRLAVLGSATVGELTSANWSSALTGAWSRVAIGDATLTASGRLLAPVWAGLSLPEEGGPEVHAVPMDAQALELLDGDRVDAVVGWRSLLGHHRGAGQVLVDLPGKGHAAHFYVAVQSQKAEHPKDAQAFMDFLVTAEAGEIWKKWDLAGK